MIPATIIAWLKIGGLVLEVILIPLIPAALWFWKVYRDRIKDEDLRQTIDDAVRAAEELKASGALKLASKQEYVWSVINSKFPGAASDREDIETLIHAAIQYADIGASGKEKD